MNTDKSKQILSSMLDNEADEAALIEALDGEECVETWHRYQLVRSVIRKEHSAYCDLAFTQSISSRVAELPAHHSKGAGKGAKIIQFTRRWRRTGGGLAVAASVAAAMVFSVQTTQFSQIESDSQSVAIGEGQSEHSNENLAVAEQQELEAIQRLLWLRSQHALRRGESTLVPQTEMVSGEQTRSYLISNEQWKEIERKLRERQAAKQKQTNTPR